MESGFDYVVIGAGITGAAIAAHLSAESSVCVLEMEAQPGYHTTGRSAAQFSEVYGNNTVRRLTRASRAFYDNPPEGFCATALLSPRPVLLTQRIGQEAAYDAYIDDIPSAEIAFKTVDEALELCPILRPEGMIGAALSLGRADIEVHELHQGYLRQLKANGGLLRTDARVRGLARAGSSWRLDTTDGEVRAGTLINAAGAWAGEVGRMAGALDLGMQPLRRTACLVEPPAGLAIENWPMLNDVAHQYYMKPDAGMLLLSPADETPSEPCDAQPEEMDLALAVDRIQQVTTLEVRRISHKWAGLRSFVPDRSPVVGYDPKQPGFFWYAAVGGYGIQTAPALSRAAAALARRKPLDEELVRLGLDASAFSPNRIVAQRL